mgnify:CR=1 FL=1|jgi:hypothetical protein
MPNYMPCRTSDDGEAHLYPAEHPDRALCGKRVDEPDPTPSGRAVCIDCAKRLLVLIFQHSGGSAISSIEIDVHT